VLSAGYFDGTLENHDSKNDVNSTVQRTIQFRPLASGFNACGQTLNIFAGGFLRPKDSC
jgi:hypothetical protein